MVLLKYFLELTHLGWIPHSKTQNPIPVRATIMILQVENSIPRRIDRGGTQVVKGLPGTHDPQQYIQLVWRCMLLTQHLGRKGRRISSVTPSSATKWIWGQPGVHRTLFQKSTTDCFMHKMIKISHELPSSYLKVTFKLQCISYGKQSGSHRMVGIQLPHEPSWMELEPFLTRSVEFVSPHHCMRMQPEVPSAK